MNSRGDDIERERDGTCAWLLQHPTYQKWDAHQRGILWIKGSPGVGKSTLLKFALRNRVQQNDTLAIPFTVSFFFHGRGVELQKNRLGFYKSIAHQLFTRFPHHIALWTMRERHQNAPPSIVELQYVTKSAILEVLQEMPIRMYIDALDECGKEAAIQIVTDLGRLISKCSSARFGLSVCFACRHYPIISLDNAFTITVEQENRHDIKRYIRDEFNNGHLGNSVDLEELQEIMQARSNGVFQWVVLIVPRIIDMYLDGDSKSVILKTLRAIPQELSDLYEDIFRKLKHPLQSLKLYQWIYFARRPLSVTEIRWAMNVDANPNYHSLKEWQKLECYIEDDSLMERKLRSLSGGLAEIIVHSGGIRIVQFIHLSVNDYLLAKGLYILDNALDSASVIGLSHARLSQSCFAYFTARELGGISSSPWEAKQQFPFLEYARGFCLTHAKISEENGVSQQYLLHYLQKPRAPNLEHWIRIGAPLKVGSGRHFLSKGSTVLHAASTWHLSSLVSIICNEYLAEDVDMNSRNFVQQTPLMRAVISGDAAIVGMMLARDDVKVNLRDKDGCTSLMYALHQPKNKIIELLLARKDLNVNIRDEDDWTPLMYAARMSMAVAVQMLLQREDIDVNVQDEDKLTPLMHAVRGLSNIIIRTEESIFIIRLLIQRRDIRVNLQDKDGFTALTHAANLSTGSLAYRVVHLLLRKKGVDVNMRDNDGWTPLAYANSQALVRLLQSHNAIL